jgi:hypothetical protein
MVIKETSVFTKQVLYWAQKQDVMLLLLMYGKNQQDDLTPKQKAVLKKLIQEEYP